MDATPNHASQNPIDEWLSRTFPLRHVVCAEIGTDLRGRTPIPVEWCAFASLWTSYIGGFHTVLRFYGNATAQVALLGGLRQADLLVGTTVLEIKSGRLDKDRYVTQLINQMITYALLAQYDGHPVTHVAVYAIRYQRLLRFRIGPFLDRLAGRRIDMDGASADLADTVRASRCRNAA
jgi:hypothetical protein